MQTTRTRVLIVEDHQVVAEGLAELINDQNDLMAVGSAGSVTEAIALATELEPDIVLMDFYLIDGSGSAAGHEIRQICPDTKLLFLTREDGYAARIAALEAGASGLIHKSHAAKEVIDAMRVVANGDTLYTLAAIAQLLDKRREVQSKPERLTPREKDVLQMMAEGNASRGIASTSGSATRQ
ncbi:MAG: response regulator transcription factor, partial [Candidatus Dormibacteraeota bacterium]|nr:response regulator transcription factor [Candidatus Dormibacteraeota bacterium]